MQIDLQPYYTPPGEGDDLGNARLKIVVARAVDITENIFLHEAYTILKDTGLVQENRFIAVAKPGDFDVYPVGAPAAGQEPPYFRLDCMDAVFNSTEIMLDTMSDITKEVQQLLDVMVRLDKLEDQPLITIHGRA